MTYNNYTGGDDMIKDYIYIEFKKSKKWKELFSLSSLETICSAIISFIVFIVICIIFKTSTIEDINNLIRTLTKDIALALLGLLGFLVTALAILLSGISSDVMNIITDRKKDAQLNNIFLSFYFEGLLIVFSVIFLIVLYIVSYINLPFNSYLSIFLICIFSYIICFILFYSVGLLGNCIIIFRIINNYSYKPPNSKKHKK